MNLATPHAAVEGSEIVPDRRRSQGLVFHSRGEGGHGMSFPLDVSDGAKARLGNVQSEIEAGVAGTQGDAAQFAVRVWGT